MHAAAYVFQHMLLYAEMEMHTLAYLAYASHHPLANASQHTLPHSCESHVSGSSLFCKPYSFLYTSAYVSIRQHTSTHVSVRVCIRQHTSA